MGKNVHPPICKSQLNNTYTKKEGKYDYFLWQQKYCNIINNIKKGRSHYVGLGVGR